eukprot:TRINITY_DN729_c0_g1_i1.p1 TRINITY_DN729_c0_g1~~TRINITY_DN729_c0_g1_i1.p1  ORF type:complete len:311 (+),score=85.64 TRINITY_DN729_c0_g1_i1:77-1009(+)
MLFGKFMISSVAAFVAIFALGGVSATPASPSEAVPVEEDKPANLTAAIMEAALAADREASEVGFEAASVLGLQRSVIVSKTAGEMVSGKHQATPDEAAALAAFLEQDIDIIPFEKASPLGFQRSVSLTRNKAVYEDDNMPASVDITNGSALGLQRSMALKKGEKAVYEDENMLASVDITNGSALGLQRSMALKKGEKAVYEDENMLASVDITNGSALGLQHSTTLKKGEKAPVEDNSAEDGIAKATSGSMMRRAGGSGGGRSSTGSNAGTVAVASEGSMLEVAASVLGLQRSTTIIRRQTSVTEGLVTKV